VLATMTVVAVVMVTQRKVSQSVADEVRAALDVDETTMRP